MLTILLLLNKHCIKYGYCFTAMHTFLHNKKAVRLHGFF
ncbi:hypothetical protein PCIT_a0608 [Pseudoalteromonas citrea]|uniref:Uncharacterized protein n=1 Tax=Pseudoalteromonas citrea TaxID=43655 RepID=A0AAD4FT41_9GAMM|nr:hypothetical protein PCIT_a0608 [Pseudoalteromonas citrea]